MTLLTPAQFEAITERFATLRNTERDTARLIAHAQAQHRTIATLEEAVDDLNTEVHDLSRALGEAQVEVATLEGQIREERSR